MARRKRHPEPADRWRPWLAAAAAALLVAQPLAGSESAATTGDGLPGVMLWIALGTFWALGALGRKRFTLRFGWTGAALVLLVAWHTIAALAAARMASPRPAVNVLWIWVGFALSFFLARQLFVGRREIRAMLVGMVAVAVALSGYAVYQRLVELPASWEAFKTDPVGAMQAAGVSAEPGSPEALLFERRLYSFEPMATFSLTNSLAGYLAPWLAVAVGIGLSGGRAPRKRLLTALAAALVAAAIAACLVWTKSRSAYLATLAGLPAVMWACRAPRLGRGWKLAAGAAVGVGVLAAVTVFAMRLDERILTQASLSLGYRMQYWRSSLAMIADHPVAGCGPGQFQSEYTAYRLPEASEEIADPHNFFLEVWATAGTPAALALVAVLGSFAWIMIRRHDGEIEAKPDSPQQPDAALHVLAGVAAGFLLGFVLRLAGSLPANPMVVVLGLTPGALTVAGLYYWIDDGRLSNLLPPVAVAVLLINLLAAGGIGFPGVSGTLWLLMAVGLNLIESDRHAAGQKTALALTAVGLVMAVACYTSAYGPVLGCRWRTQRAYEDAARAEEHLLAAAAADPLAAQPWNVLAGMALMRWQEAPTPAAYEALQHAQREFLRLLPNSAAAAAAAADRYYRAYAVSGSEDPLAEAVQLYGRAVRLYPNHAVFRAKLAVAMRSAGDLAGFAREAARALELDAITPHSDKKLPDKLRTTLQRSSIDEP